MVNTQNFQEIVQQAFNAAKNNPAGNNADYIPFLKNIPSDLGAVAIVTASGEVFSAGDDDYRFAIESISKFCTLALALEEQGPEVVKDKIGASPTGLPFNSVTALELHGGKPLSPLVNAGAMSTVSLLNAKTPDDKWQSILTMQQQLGSSKIAISPELNQSEQDTNFHNRAIAWLLYSAGYLYSDPMEACDVYTRQCSTLLTVVELATMGATIANKGTNPITKQAVLKPDNVSYILAEMMMEGMYDSSGEWAYTVGLPSKSGVGGGVLSIVPGVMGIAAFSPKLDPVGNSVRGQQMIQYIADQLNLSLFKK
ncbi:glutaminase A [Ignatzschineria sp. LJL83]